MKTKASQIIWGMWLGFLTVAGSAFIGGVMWLLIVAIQWAAKGC